MKYMALKNMSYKFFVTLLFVFKILNVSALDFSITGIFAQANEISFAFFPQGKYTQAQTIKVNIIPDTVQQTYHFSIPVKDFNSSLWMWMQTEHNIDIKELKIDGIIKLNATEIRKALAVHPKNCPNNIELFKKEEFLSFQKDSSCLILFSPSFFYQSPPIGLQLFLRLSFLATLLILIFILTKQALLFSITLFLASLPLKIDYTNYTMALMILTMIIAFIHNRSRHFSWQPIFYVLCAIYLLNVIGLTYASDFKLGIKRLDTITVLVIFPVIFCMIQFQKRNVILILRFFVWSVIAFCTFGLLSYATIVPELTWDMVFADSKLYAPLLMMWPAHPHPSYLSIILLMAVPIALYLRFHNEKQITLIEMLLGVSLPIIFTILGGARVGMIVAPLLLGLGYLFYCKFKPVLKWGLVVAGMVAMGILLHLFPKTDDRFVDPIRSDLRKTAISAIKEKPVFGWGTGYVKPLIQSEERAHSLGIETPYALSSFHNQYFEDTVQFGIPGIIILLTLFGWMLWIGIREKNYLLLSLLVIYMIFCWTESALFISKGVIPFAFWLCFLMTNRTTLFLKTGDHL